MIVRGGLVGGGNDMPSLEVKALFTVSAVSLRERVKLLNGTCGVKWHPRWETTGGAAFF